MRRRLAQAHYAIRSVGRLLLRYLDPVLLVLLPSGSRLTAQASLREGFRRFAVIKQVASGQRRSPRGLRELADDAVRHLDDAVAGNTALFLAHRLASTCHSLAGDVDAFYRRLVAYGEAKDAYAASRQLDRLGIRCIPPYPLMRTIGNTAVYESLVKCRTLDGETSRLFLLYDRRRAGDFVNPHMLTYWRDYMTVIDDPETIRALTPMLASLTDDDSGPIKFSGRYLPTHSALALAGQQWEDENRSPIFSLRPVDRERGMSVLREIGLDEDDWFVCLHVREGGAKGNEPFRQAPISDYIPAIEAVTRRGGWVFRMGDPSMTPLPAIDRVVDYATSTLRQDWMDVFLCGACRFFIGTSSGLYTVAHAFGRPIVQTNYLPTSTLSLGTKDLFLPKLTRYRRTGELMPFADLMGPPFNNAGNDALYREVFDVTIINNTPEELLEVVEEMMDQLAQHDQEDDALQARFRALTAEVGTLVGLPGVPLNCRIGSAFLNRHRDLLPPLTSDT
ncbi:MAG TPA: hypothetical protein DIW51_13135 [Rhodospirillaceae bacterium]|nr:hypothetical protein [Magnetovibrio sp.]HBT43841.1 hypothetical protein [Rhodospirillaceae bacterium]HCS70900.1 hypothetical protein [Rhodospirillaceae bacterium]|tara:strand:+ start:1109 stop:2623 length:1515 start_codon:yes stop_codon:yes gene_type:complete